MDIKLVDAATDKALDQGIKIFQIHRFAETEFGHVERLLQWAELPGEARVVDMGSGTGEMAGIFNDIRDDLDFTLVNISEKQLAYSPKNMQTVCRSFTDTGLESHSFDVVMFCFSIGHESYREALTEAGRLLKKGGVLFIYDMARISGTNKAMKEVNYHVFDRYTLEQEASDRMFRLDFYLEPQDNGDFGRKVLGDEYDRIFAGTVPAIWRFIKC